MGSSLNGQTIYLLRFVLHYHEGTSVSGLFVVVCLISPIRCRILPSCRLCYLHRGFPGIRKCAGLSLVQDASGGHLTGRYSSRSKTITLSFFALGELGSRFQGSATELQNQKGAYMKNTLHSLAGHDTVETNNGIPLKARSVSSVVELVTAAVRASKANGLQRLVADIQAGDCRLRPRSACLLQCCAIV